MLEPIELRPGRRILVLNKRRNSTTSSAAGSRNSSSSIRSSNNVKLQFNSGVIRGCNQVFSAENQKDFKV